MRSLVVRALVALLATIATWSMLPAVSHAAFPGVNGKLAFGSARNGFPADNDLFTMAGDGTSQLRITSLNLDELNPSWSPNGHEIVFERNNGFRSDVWIADANGLNARQLAPHPRNDTGPAFSNTGTQIVFASDRGNTEGVSDLFVMNKDGTGLVNITNTATFDETDPAWSPDGTAIAYSRDGDIYKVLPAGTNPTPVTTGAPIDTEPDWSPSTTAPQIVFHRYENFGDELRRINANGTGLAFLTTNGSIPEEHPTWSPDGTKIAFIRGAFKDAEVYTMNPDGTVVTRITTNGVMDSSPAWQVSPTTPPPPPPAPDTAISVGPPAQTPSTSARFEFTSDQASATFRCSLDGAAFTACSSPVDYGNLAVGAHSFAVAAVGATGLVDPSPASRFWTVSAPPATNTNPPPAPALPAVVTDKAAPSAGLTYAKRQRTSSLSLVVQLNEAATVTVGGSVAAGGASKVYKFKSVSRSVKANQKVKLRLKLRAKALKAIKRALRRRKLTAKITVTAKDQAGNKKTSTARIKLKR